MFLENELNTLKIIGGSEGKYIPDSVANDVDHPVIYSANFIKYRLKDDESDFEGKVKIKHDRTDLDAGFVSVNWQNNLLNALPRTASDTISEPLFPVIKEDGRDPMTGDAMIYNLKTRKGKISKGQTKADDGYYTGKKIRNESETLIHLRR